MENPRMERREKIPINKGVSIDKKESMASRIRFPYTSTMSDMRRMIAKAIVYISEEKRFHSQFRLFFAPYILSRP